jgi:pilus assembly protein CpaB
MFKSTSVAVKQASAGAIADTAQLHGKVTASDINPGEQLTAADFVAKGGLTSELAPAQRAITVALDQSHGMVGQVQPGDHVDVYAGVSIEPKGGRSEPALRLLMTNIKVLQVGSGSGGVGQGANATSNVTLDVSDTQVGALAYASDNGKVWLVLRPADATSSSSSTAITAQSLLLGSKPIAAGGSK